MLCAQLGIFFLKFLDAFRLLIEAPGLALQKFLLLDLVQRELLDFLQQLHLNRGEIDDVRLWLLLRSEYPAGGRLF